MKGIVCRSDIPSAQMEKLSNQDVGMIFPCQVLCSNTKPDKVKQPIINHSVGDLKCPFTEGCYIPKDT